MTVASIRALIYAVVNNVQNAGLVYDYYRWSRDLTTFYDFYKTTIDGTAQVRGWAVSFEGFDEERTYLGRSDKGSHRTYHWRLDGYMGLDDSAATEKTFDNLCEAVAESLYSSNTINVASVCSVREMPSVTTAIEQWAGHIAHHAIILFDVEEDNANGYYLFHDTFTGSGNLGAHTPDLDRKGNGWTGTDLATYSDLSGGGALIQSSYPAVVDVEETDCTLVLEHLTSVNNDERHIIIRYTDDSNFWRAKLDDSNETLSIIEYNTGVATTRATAAITGVTNTDTLRAVVSDTSIIAEVLTSTGAVLNRVRYDSATFNQTATKFGCTNSRPSAGLDEFSIYWSASDD